MIVVEQRDFKVRTVDGANIAVRETRALQPVEGRTPIILLRAIPSAAHDEPATIDVFAAALARAGHICFAVDLRGFGKSDRPAMTMGSARRPAPVVHSIEIARDLDAAANELRKVSGQSKVAVVQWGAPVGIVYAALWPEKVSHLVLCDVEGDPVVDSPTIQVGLSEQGDFEVVQDPAETWPAPVVDSMEPAQAVTLPRRLALHDLARSDPGSRIPDDLAMNYAHHIYCKVMVVESGRGPDIHMDGRSSFRSEFIRARDVCVHRPDAAKTGASSDSNLGFRSGLIDSVAEFLG